MALRVKICGLKDPDAIAAANAGGAAYVGFVVYPPSPRAVSVDKIGPLAQLVTPGIVKVALMVDPDDALIDAVAAQPIDMIQLQGPETPERVAAVKDRTGLPVMKAIGVREAGDLDAVARYAPVADQILVDAKAPAGAARPGGNGGAFDWTLLTGRRWPIPWMLAGGLSIDNVAEAARVTHAAQVDLSSGVDSAPGVKDPKKIEAFLSVAARC